MSRLIFTLLVSLFLGALACCQREVDAVTKPPLFDSVPSAVTVTPLLDEVSGIADSKRNPGFLWAHEDGGNPPVLYLIRHDGLIAKEIYLHNIANRDWEDMVLVRDTVYIGEIGDNNEVHSECTIYKFPEPAAATDTVRNITAIRFRYEDGPRDAEAFLVDPSDGAIYLITKRDVPARIYKLTPPFNGNTVHVARQVGNFFSPGIVSAALSPDGREIIAKTYLAVAHYQLSEGETLAAALGKVFQPVPYQVEPQGEAVCFSADNRGYFTLSELGNAAEVKLYFYQRR